jgi:hypothetical protein
VRRTDETYLLVKWILEHPETLGVPEYLARFLKVQNEMGVLSMWAIATVLEDFAHDVPTLFTPARSLFSKDESV